MRQGSLGIIQPTLQCVLFCVLREHPSTAALNSVLRNYSTDLDVPILQLEEPGVQRVCCREVLTHNARWLRPILLLHMSE